MPSGESGARIASGVGRGQPASNPRTLEQFPLMICHGPQGVLQIPKTAAVSLSPSSEKSKTDPRVPSGYETDPDEYEDLEFIGLTSRAPSSPVTKFTPGSLDLNTLQSFAPPDYATTQTSNAIARELKTMRQEMESTPLHELGWYIDLESVENMFQLIVELHSFDLSLPLAKDMEKAAIESVVLEVRFGRDFPMSPPFIRVIRPRFLPFQRGGGGHVTIGGAICMELLTNSGWSPACSLETVLVQVRAAICSLDPAARLESYGSGLVGTGDYNLAEAVDAYERYARNHGWQIPKDIREIIRSSSSGY